MSSFTTIRRRAAKALVPTLAAATVAIATATPASATVSPGYGQGRSTTGAAATCWVAKATSTTSTVTCTISDTARDGYSVYLDHQVLAFPRKQIHHSGGAGTSRTVTFTVQSDTYRYNWHFRVCRQVEGWSDNCSTWAYFYVS